MNNNSIIQIIDTADSYKQNNLFKKAYFEYEKALPLIFAMAVKNRRSKSIGNIAGWSTGILTGGFSIEDIFLIPLVSKGVSSMMGVDDNFIKQSINIIALRQIDCVMHDKDLIISANKDEVIQKFALLYSSNKKNNLFDSILNGYLPDLVNNNPFEDPLVTSAAYAFVFEEVLKPSFDNESYNYLLYSYLSKINDDSDLFQYLSKQYGKKNESKENKSDHEKPAGNNNKEYSYNILGLSKGASKEEIRSAYIALIKKYHPDKFESLSKEFQELANKKTQLIIEAYNYLMGI